MRHVSCYIETAWRPDLASRMVAAESYDRLPDSPFSLQKKKIAGQYTDNHMYTRQLDESNQQNY